MSSLQFGWLVLNIKPKEGKRAEENLLNQGYEPYFPVLHSSQLSKTKTVIKKQAMFPGYAFLKSEPNLEIKPVRSTRGVIKIIRFGDKYPVLDNQVIQSFKEVEIESINNPNKESYRIGEFIEILTGPLKDQEAVITATISEQRVEILFSLLNRAHTIQVDTSIISKK